MIQCIHRNQLDVAKYNACIATSIQSRIYAYAWYLDCVCEEWRVLVLDDYKAVMPLPYRRKYGFRYISQPFFTQQLGVFSKAPLSSELIAIFVGHIPTYLLKVHLQFNSENRFTKEPVVMQSNFILDLQGTYSDLYARFSKGRKHAIQQGIKKKVHWQEVSFDEVLRLSRAQYSFQDIAEKEYRKLTKLIAIAKDKNKVKIIGVRENAELIGGAVFLLGAKRIVYLFAAVSPRGKKLQVPSLLLNAVIQEHAGSSKILDFEGSVRPGIAAFFKSFGAEVETYGVLKKSLL